jgi:hypoxanthine-DNA glycosylase
VVIKSSFEAVADLRTRVLVLGSLPGEASLRQAQYYAHPANHFWRLMAAVTGRDLVGRPYAARLEMLLESGVGLWDVIGSARRVGSLDAQIRDHTPNALRAFIETLPALRAIGFNGRKASDIGRRQLGADPGPALFTLPSSSPAHAVPLARKQAEWMQLTPFIEQPGSPAADRLPDAGDGS